MNWRRLNNVLHRDLGYFFCFITVIYAASGIALNHSADWNPDYYVSRASIHLQLPRDTSMITKAFVIEELEKVHQADGFLMYDFPTASKLKIYFKNGALLYDLESGGGEIERVTKRPLLYEFNFMHRNPGKIWTWVSDIFAFSLIVLAVSGLFILRGKNGITGRGAWLSGGGLIITLIIMFILLN